MRADHPLDGIAGDPAADPPDARPDQAELVPQAALRELEAAEKAKGPKPRDAGAKRGAAKAIPNGKAGRTGALALVASPAAKRRKRQQARG